MRVTHVITRLIVGGAQENTVNSVLGLRQRPDMDVNLISGPTTGPEGSIESEVASIPGLLTILPELVRPVHPWKDTWALRRLAEIFRAQRSEIVHTHSGKAGVLGRLAARRAGVPVIVHTIHGPSFGSFQGALANGAVSRCRALCGQSHHAFRGRCPGMTEQYLAAGIGRRAQYTRIVSGFVLQPFLSARDHPELRERLGIGPGDFVVGKIARLSRLKGHDDLFCRRRRNW